MVGQREGNVKEKKKKKRKNWLISKEEKKFNFWNLIEMT